MQLPPEVPTMRSAPVLLEISKVTSRLGKAV
jgi:hypothetical protein